MARKKKWQQKKKVDHDVRTKVVMHELGVSLLRGQKIMPTRYKLIL